MKASAPIVEPTLHGAPLESVLAVESPQGFELGDLDHRRHLLVLDAESCSRLTDPPFTQDDDLPAFSEFPTDHRPLLQSDVIQRKHRG